MWGARVIGQTFTLPSSHTSLHGLSIWMAVYPPDPNAVEFFDMQVNAYLVGWDGQKATGPILASAVHAEQDYRIPFDPKRIDFNFAPVELEAGQQYVAIFQQVLPERGQPSLGPAIGFVPSAGSLDGSTGMPYAGSFELAHLLNWTIIPVGNIVVEFRYIVPEPATWLSSVLALAIVGAVQAARRGLH
jgi:hypothetical protein